MITANKVFDEMPRKDLDTWNAMIFVFLSLESVVFVECSC